MKYTCACVQHEYLAKNNKKKKQNNRMFYRRYFL